METVDENIIKQTEKFVCEIYGKKKLSSLNDAIFDVFLGKYKPKKNNNPISFAKRIDGGYLPPCSKVMELKTRRANLIAARWLQSTNRSPPSFDPKRCGWNLTEDGYSINWFEGDMTPRSLGDIVLGENDSDVESDNFSDSSDEE